jgi:hypothetical protein
MRRTACAPYPSGAPVAGVHPTVPVAKRVARRGGRRGGAIAERGAWRRGRGSRAGAGAHAARESVNLGA